MTPITLILPYYCQPQMLAQQHAVWAQLPEDIRAHLHVIVVDDASPKKPARIQPVGVASMRLFRITEDVRWNWLAARNLGMHHSTTLWNLLTDLDHVVPAETWRAVMSQELDTHLVYRFARRQAPTLETRKSHPNTWLMTTAMYDAVGGYDERLSGIYGTDAEFRDRIVANSTAIQVRTEPVICYGSDMVDDAETVAFGRRDHVLDELGLLRARRTRDQIENWRPLRLTFPFEHVATILPEAVAC